LAQEADEPIGSARARITYFAYRGSAAVLRVLPGPFSRAVGAGSGLVAWAVGRSRRRIVAENLSPVLGVAADDPRMRRVVRRAYSSYGVYWSDAARLTTADALRHPKRFHVEGGEKLWKAVGDGKGLILVLPHVGCWEAGAAWTSANGYPLTTVAEVLEPKELYDWFVERRKAYDLTVLPLAAATVSRLLAELAVGNVIALLADRDVGADGLQVKFFGRTTTVPGGPSLLALRSGAPVIPCAIYVERYGHYTLCIEDPVDIARSGRVRDDVARVSQEIADAFERLISRRPEQWHVFQPFWNETEQGSPTR
jgi:phosphatidylinositol dimannoside acyltransferase